MHKVKISVRNLVEFILRSGDLLSGAGVLRDASNMQAGSAAHRKLQQEAGPDYRAEVTLKMEVPVGEDLVIALEGRADGIIEELHFDNEGTSTVYTIDEIKGIVGDVRKLKEPVPVHLGQAKCYAYMFAVQEKLTSVRVQMTYVRLDPKTLSPDLKKTRQFLETYETEDLRLWFTDLLDAYAVWVRQDLDWKTQRDTSIAALRFPFEYRPGQKKLIAGVYQTMIRRKKLFIQAPTGTGKTISTLFPAIKVMGEGLSEKIFYLTAKTITRTVAEETLGLLADAGLRFRSVTITAKEKCCILEDGPKCSPKTCPRAAGHFDRINRAVMDLITHVPRITREEIEDYAALHQVCPFELQLDAALWVDGVICDYNYVFDPYVYLKRFFGETHQDYLLLVDEAHNLAERARDMFSSEICISQLSHVRRLLRGMAPAIVARIGKCIKYMETVREEYGPECIQVNSASGLTLHLLRMIAEMETFLKDQEEEGSGADLTVREAVLDLYLEARRFVNTYDGMEESRYIEYARTTEDGDYILKLLCVDPSKNLSLRMDLGRSAILFSATLLPVQYYKEMLSVTPKEDYDLYAQSPFDRDKKLLLLAGDVSSRYTRRNAAEYERIADYIRAVLRSHPGNYMVFFPSYAYLQSVLDIFSEKEMGLAGSGLRLLVQTPGMDEDARQAFLEAFCELPDQRYTARERVVGFCVLGGIFSEGIDLKADRLIGVVIVGTGLPGIGDERELLRAFYDRKCGMGFEYAYQYPGMNKVLQAGGRVIRTEADRGVILLLDERFAYSSYRALFPREWENGRKVSLKSVQQALDDFWGAQ